MAMSPSKMFTSLIVAFFLICSVSAKSQRKLHTTLYCPKLEKCRKPDPQTGSYTNVAYTRADGTTNTLHYIYSSRGLPTLLVAQTSRKSNISIDWDAFLSSNYSDVKKSITFTHKPDYAYAVVFNKLYEYDDVDDVADMDKIPNNSSYLISHQLNDVVWDDSSVDYMPDTHTFKYSVSINSSSLLFSGNGSLSFTLMIHGKEVRNSVLPHLAFNANTSQFDVQMIGLEPAFSSSRFALEMLLVTSIPEDSNRMDIKTHTTIDDEHSPGTFQMLDWTSEGDAQMKGAFVQWKPVCYSQLSYNTQTASKVKHYELQNTTEVFALDTHPHLLYAYFGDELTNGSLGVKSLNVSYGIIGDKFYAHTSYTGWMFSVGSGVPPSDVVSLMVIMVISVGLGIPVLLISGGGVTMCVKKRRQQKNALYSDISSPYTPIQ